MRETTLGRWMVRLAVTIGAGAMALGVSTAAAQASDVTSSRGSAPLAGAVQVVGVAHAVSVQTVNTVRVTEDFGWS